MRLNCITFAQAVYVALLNPHVCKDNANRRHHKEKKACFCYYGRQALMNDDIYDKDIASHAGHCCNSDGSALCEGAPAPQRDIFFAAHPRQ